MDSTLHQTFLVKPVLRVCATTHLAEVAAGSPDAGVAFDWGP